jgi:hypothetical protein
MRHRCVTLGAAFLWGQEVDIHLSVGGDPAQKAVKPRYCPVYVLPATAGVGLVDEDRLPTPLQVVHQQVLNHPVTEVRGEDGAQLGAGFEEADETRRLEGALHLVLRLFGVLVSEVVKSEPAANPSEGLRNSAPNGCRTQPWESLHAHPTQLFFILFSRPQQTWPAACLKGW